MSTSAQDVALHALCEQLQKIHQQSENARLIALLEDNGIEWRLPPATIFRRY